MFARIKLYLFFAVMFWIFNIPIVQEFLNSPFLTAGIVGVIVFLILIAAIHSVRIYRKQKQKNKVEEDDTHLFL